MHQMSATDEDRGWDGEVDFLFSAHPDIPFIILQNGVVILAGNLDRETTPSYSFEVIIADKSKVFYSKNKKHSENADTSTSLIIVYTQKDISNQSSLI